MSAANASTQLMVDRFERPSFPMDGTFVVPTCAAFGVVYLLAVAASVYVMHSSAFTLSEAAHAALAARLPRRWASVVLAHTQRTVNVAIVALEPYANMRFR